MPLSRRSFVTAAVAGVSVPTVSGSPSASRVSMPTNRFDPWLEIDAAALRHNVQEVARLTSSRPIMAVVKNNAYGLGLQDTAKLLATLPEIAGFAVVKTAAAIALREAGVQQPILLMGMFAAEDLDDLVHHHIQLSLYTDDAIERLRPALSQGRAIDTHLYIDTGMGRMGMPYHRARPWITSLGRVQDLTIRGLYTAFTEETDFDGEQLRRFLDLVNFARSGGVTVGQLHAASSNAVFHLPAAHLDMVRPGIALYGAYPSEPETEREMSQLRCAFRLKARVVRVEQLRTGDSVSYGRNYIAERPTWIATLPVGHADGYTRRAVAGARVLIGDSTYPVIGAVSASHTIVELGERSDVEVGDIATLIGPDVPDIEPNVVAAATGTSVYDLLMHLNPGMPRVYQ